VTSRATPAQPVRLPRRRRGQRRRPAAQGRDERGDVGLPDLAQVAAAALAQVAQVAVEIGAVGRERVGRAPPLDGQVVQERLRDLLHVHPRIVPDAPSPAAAARGNDRSRPWLDGS
jgi:hypothetical protein